ncbi:response regulator [Faecalicatena sp. AGMB00832]|uniref:Response regulator n=1 Tax=Faecalicatena faecalis TaxID=2726362 RepID=A0ABS6D8J8_9FIRM|nr:ATP-binding protein [Faecalicatena sp.]MBU3877512.1 response regulator [Faecalicatena faecalis]MCI6464243.1 ATP-binding protein [Faecalicatena sp.]MDY5621210.1 ATP-binding protein [Lachnospiraceae bacterium]
MKNADKNIKKYRSGKLVLMIAAIIFVVLAAGISTNLVGRIRERVRSTSVQVISELTDNKAKVLVDILNEAEDDLLVLSRYLGEEKETVRQVQIIDQFQATHSLEALAVQDANGNDIYGNVDEMCMNGIPEEFDEALDVGPLEAVWDTALDLSGRRMVLFGVSIPGGGCIYGALGAESLENAYGETTYVDEGYSYIVKKDGDIVLPPVRYSYEQIYMNIENLLKANGNEKEKVNAFMKSLNSGDTGSVVFSFDGNEQLICFEPLALDKAWQIITVVPLAAVEADGHQIIRMSVYMAVCIVAALALVLICGIAFFFFNQRKQKENDKFLRRIYQAISENIDTVIFILDDASSTLDYVFENSQRILGIGAEEFIDQVERIDHGFQVKLEELMQMERPKKWAERELQVYNDRMNQDMRLKVISCPFYLGDSRKYIFSVTDVTEEYKSRENIIAAVTAAEQANAAKSQFLANMSHDIRTPMNGIVGMTSIAMMNLDDRDRVEDCLKKIDLSSKMLLGLINDVLDMSKIESGKLVLSREPFDLKDFLDNIETVFQNQFHAKNQEFSMQVQIEHRELSGDKTRLNQIFVNLLSNAVKFTPENGKITLLVQELGQRHTGFAAYRFQVTDTGIGMEPEFLKRIFDPFERADGGIVNRTEGTGLGMAITKNLVTAMGGQISVESKPGQGTTFCVEMELASQDTSRLESSSIKEDQQYYDYSAKRFLLAEDNELNREIAVELLGSRGAIVEWTENGKEAVDRFVSRQEGYYDAILMDIQMPVMNGYEAAQAIRASDHPQAASIPIIAMTANAYVEDVKAAKDAGMNGHVAKPIDIDQISRALSEAM